MTIHKPFRHVAWRASICGFAYHPEQVAGNVAVQIMRKTKFPSVSCTRAPLEGDHIRLDFKIIAVALHRHDDDQWLKDKMDAACGQQLQSLFGIRGQRMVGRAACHLNQTQQPDT